MSDPNPFQACVLEGWPAVDGTFELCRDAASRKRLLDDGTLVDERLNSLLDSLGGCTTPDEALDLVRLAGDAAMAEISDHLARNAIPPHALSLTARAIREINVAVWEMKAAAMATSPLMSFHDRGETSKAKAFPVTAAH